MKRTFKQFHDQKPSDDFMEAFTSSSEIKHSRDIVCHCGRRHIYKKGDTGPIEFVSFDRRRDIVLNCPCNFLGEFETVILKHRDAIGSFLTEKDVNSFNETIHNTKNFGRSKILVRGRRKV